MANDNTLGAPTEGLGQTVTFASGQRTGVPQATAIQRGDLRASATGGAAVRTAQALQVPTPKGDTLFQTLARLGGDLIKPQLEAERTLKYVEGMQKAASGQAIEEIVNEQPFFSSLFGSSSVVDGARAYSASAKATAMAVDFETNMGELRKLSPAEMSQYTASKITEATSGGDAITNAMIVQQVSSTLPAVMKGQTKAHLRYQQEVRIDATSSKYDADFALLQANAVAAGKPDATKTVDDVIQSGIEAMKGLTRDDEIDPELHSKLVAQSAAKAIMGGNFRAMEILEKSQKLAELTPDDQYRVKRAYNVAVSEAKGKMPLEFYTKVLEFQLKSDQPESNSRESIQAAADEINNEWKRLKGDFGNYIEPRDIMGEQMQLARAERQRLAQLAREAESGATLASRTQAKEDWARDTFALAMNPDPAKQGELVLIDKSPTEVAAVMDYARNTIGGTKEHAFFIAQQAKARVFDEDLKQVHSSAIEGVIASGNGVQMDEYYTKLYKPLIEAAGGRGEVVAQLYAGEHKDKMARYHALRRTVTEPTITDLSTFAMRALSPNPAPAPGGERADAILAAAKDNRVLAYLGRGLNGDTIPMENPEGFRDLMWPLLSTQLPPEEALELAKDENRDIVALGGKYWKKQPNQKRLDEWLVGNSRAGGVMSGDINKATKLAIDTYAARAGIDGTPGIIQLPNVNGVPHMALWGKGADGKQRIQYLNGEDVHTTWANRKPVVINPMSAAGAAAMAFPFGGEAALLVAPAKSGSREVSGKITN